VSDSNTERRSEPFDQEPLLNSVELCRVFTIQAAGETFSQGQDWCSKPFVLSAIARSGLSVTAEEQKSYVRSLVNWLLFQPPFAAPARTEGLDWSLRKSQSGAPRLFLGSLPSSIDVSFAHSGQWLAAGLSMNADIGIDIEQFKARDNLPAMAHYMGWSDQVDDTKDFLLRWTLWEACVKMEETSIFATSSSAFDSLSGQCAIEELRGAGPFFGFQSRQSDNAIFSMVWRQQSAGAVWLRDRKFARGALQSSSPQTLAVSSCARHKVSCRDT